MSEGEVENSDDDISETDVNQLRGELLHSQQSEKRGRKISEHRDDHDDAVAIKPPQADAHHRSHHRKHRKDRKREKEESRHRSRSPSSKHSDRKKDRHRVDSPLRDTTRRAPDQFHMDKQKRAEEGWAQWKKSLDKGDRRRSPLGDSRDRNRHRRISPPRGSGRNDRLSSKDEQKRVESVKTGDRSRSPVLKGQEKTRWLPQVSSHQRSLSKHSNEGNHRHKEPSAKYEKTPENKILEKYQGSSKGAEFDIIQRNHHDELEEGEDQTVGTPTQDEHGDLPDEEESKENSGDGQIESDADEGSVHSSHHQQSSGDESNGHENGSDSDRSSKSSGATSGDSGDSVERAKGKKHRKKKHKKDKRTNKYSKFETSSEEESEAEEVKSHSGSPIDTLKSQNGADTDGEETGNEEAPSPAPEVSEVEEAKEKEDPFALLPVYYPAISGCRSVDEFACLNRIDEGTYGVVYRCRDKRTDEMVALKRLKMEKEKDDFPITSLREIVTLLKAQHPNIITVREIVVGSNMDKIYIVMDYLEHDLKALMERMDSMKKSFLIGEVKTLMKQILSGVHHLHDNWILHRDLKTSNLLLSHKGVLKIGDFGLAREYGSPLKPYTQVVVTLWYRAPELLLGTKLYSTAIDVWSVGCIFGELLNLKAVFPGKSELDELGKIYRDLGTPTDKIWPGYSELPGVKRFNLPQVTHNQLRKKFGPDLSAAGFDLINRLLTYCPEKRISAQEALRHPWFEETPHPVHPSMFPTWPAKSEMAGKPLRTTKTPPPPPGRRANERSEAAAAEMAKMGFQLRPGAQKPGDWHLRF